MGARITLLLLATLFPLAETALPQPDPALAAATAGDHRDIRRPAAPAYQAWADVLKLLLTELLGPPAADDNAAASTGAPSARRAN